LGRHGRPGPRLLRPVCGHARLRAREGITLRANGDDQELFDTATGAAHRLSPAAAALWIDLDGRPLSEVRPVGAEDGFEVSDAEVDLAVVELVRRLKALGLVEDVP
jgi:hypothetical protein